MVVPSSVENVNPYAFSGSGLETVIFEKGSKVKHLDKMLCFGGSIKTLVLPDSLETITGSSTISCTSLEKLVIPATVHTIAEGAITSTASVNFYLMHTEMPAEWDEEFWYQFGGRGQGGAGRPRYLYSEEEPTDTNYGYWRYVNGVPTSWSIK